MQFGHSLFDTLVALELAVADSHNDAYTEQLEPALGKLVADIATSFHLVAGCIHKWRFDVPPLGLHLEEDIAQLEERMTALRPKGMAYSQAEILRAYALQLHLKQIARLLRASRVETSDVAGEGRRRDRQPRRGTPRRIGAKARVNRSEGRNSGLNWRRASTHCSISAMVMA